MICQLCLVAPATEQGTTCLRSGRIREDHYCRACYEAKYVNPPPADASFPRPRFTLKYAMILVAAFAVPNAIAAWILRSGLITGTPEHIQRLTDKTFLAINGVLGILVVEYWLIDWLGRVYWYRRTGGVIPIPKAQTRRITWQEQSRSMLQFGVVLVWLNIAKWAARRIAFQMPPSGVGGFLLFAWMFWVPVVGMLAIKLARGRSRWAQWTVQEWRISSGPERFWNVFSQVLLGGLLSVMLWSSGWLRSVWVLLFVPVLLSGLILVVITGSALVAQRR
jgi:hypothetical protein